MISRACGNPVKSPGHCECNKVNMHQYHAQAVNA